MAKPPNNTDPSEVVIFFARVKGGGEVVAQSVRALADALDRASQPRVQIRPAKPLPPSNKSHPEQLEFDPTDEPLEEDHTENVDDVAIPSSTASGRKKRGEGDLRDRNAGIISVGDIDFVPNGKDSLKTLFAAKIPSSDLDKIIVIAYFLQHILTLQKFGVNHILTAFKHVGKPVPTDLRQTLRNMKKKAWVGFNELDDIRLTTVGDNRFVHELGKRNQGTEV
jgi:hypothetical protein